MRSLAYAFGVAVLLGANTAAAEAICDQRAQLIKYLADEYKETPIAIGIVPAGGVLEVLSSAEGTSWTILASFPNGMTCIVAAGENLQMLPQLAKLGRDS